MADSLTLLLQLLLDKSAKQQTEQGINDITQALVDMDTEGIERAMDGLGKLAQAQEKVTQAFERSKKEVEAMRKLSDDIGKGSTKLIAAGSAVIGAMYLAANSEAKRIKEAGGEVDATTQRWLAAQDKLQKSYQSIGRSAMTALVPALEQAASLAEKAAKFAESNPDLVKGIATAAGITVAIGTLGKIIAGGLRMIVDAKYILANTEYAAATVLFQKSVREFLTGVAAQAAANKASGGMLFAPAQMAKNTVTGGNLPTTAVTNSLSTLGKALSVLGGIVAGVKLYDLIAEIFGLQSAGEIGAKALAIFTYALNKIGVVSDEAVSKAFKYAKSLENMRKASEDAANGIDAAANSIMGTAESMRGAAMAYGQYQQSQIATDQRYNQQKAQIEANYTQQVQGLYQSHGAAMAAIAGQLRTTLDGIEANYEAQMASMEANYQAERSSIIAQGNAQVEQIQRDAQERLRQLAEDHAERVEDLTNSRDALGLAQENRNYEKERAEEERRAKQAIAEARQQTQQQLAELERRHQLEMQEAQRQYELQKEQAKAAADEQSAQETLNFQAQLAQLMAAKEAELKQLEQAHQEEHQENYRSFLEKLRQLGYYLGGEYNLRQDYFARMLAQTEDWLKQMEAKFSEVSPEEASDATDQGTRDIGGYVGQGTYRVGAGMREFVMSPKTLRAAESAIGGRLTQDNLMMALARGASGGGSGQLVNVNVGNGMTVMQAKRILKSNNQALAKDLAAAFASI